MKESDLLNLLKCIHCNYDKLSFSNDNNSLVCNRCNSEFPILEDVPELLPQNENSNDTNPEIHEKMGTAFNYIDHYQKDAFNSDYFAQRDQGTEHSERRVREYISSEIKQKEGRILDVGCGKAWVAKLFCPKGFEVVSMDIALKNTAKALKLYPFKNHFAVVADAFSLPFKPATFDYIIASEIIEHVSRPDFFVGNLFAALKPGGKLIITTPYKEKLQYSLCIHCNRPTPLHAHIHSFDENILKNLHRSEEIKSIHYHIFGSKLLLHLRTHIVLKHLNFKFWKVLDRFVDLVYNAPTRILMVWEKTNPKN